MNVEELKVYEFLKGFPSSYVSAMEISKRLGNRKMFEVDRTWARPMLRRMEMDGFLESNPFGEYRLRLRPEDRVNFKDALAQCGGGVALGDTTIISLKDVQNPESGS